MHGPASVRKSLTRVSTCATIARRDARTRPGPAREITGIVIPVPEAQPYAAHPHITLLAPFRPRPRLDDPTCAPT